jgi:hypothetical protein
MQVMQSREIPKILNFESFDCKIVNLLHILCSYFLPFSLVFADRIVLGKFANANAFSTLVMSQPSPKLHDSVIL